MIITISRQYGAGGSEVAQRVAAELGWRVVDNELVEEVATRAGLPAADVAEREERVPSFAERLARTLAASAPELFAVRVPEGTVPKLQEADLVRITEKVVAELAAKGKVVLVGRAGPAVLARERDCLHVQLVAPRPYRIQAAAERLGIDTQRAAELVDETDSMRARYLRQYYRRDWYDPVNYHVVLNTGLMGLEGVTQVIVAEARRRGWLDGG
ncbi:MAG TPA: cytidylate kinase-like family protein [Gemmatimonadales bacterium]|nr:cytidylate kinase-like family protein [Gemmatimonadales bacterium]